MTIDKAQLKALAEASPSGPWLTEDGCLYFKDNGYTMHMFDAYVGIDLDVDDFYAALKFIAAANPDTVMGLIVECEHLNEHRKALIDMRETHGFDSWSAALVEIDKLRAELAGLRTGYDAQNNVIEGLKAENEELEKAAMSYGEDLQWHTYELGRVRAERDELRKDADRWRWFARKYEGRLEHEVDAAMAKDGVQIKAHSDPEVSDLADRIDYLEKDNASLRGSCAALGKKLTEATRNLRSAQRTLSWLMFNREISTEGMPKWVLNRFKRLIKYQEKPVE